MNVNLMLTLTMRPYQGEADLQPIADLMNICYAADKLDDVTSIPELQSEFDTPSVDKSRDLRLWEDADGKLIACGFLWIAEPSEVIDGYLSLYLHPNNRGGNLETQIIRWGEERMCEVKQEKGFSTKLRIGSVDRDTQRIAILEKQGFQCDRYFFRMERNLAEPIPEPVFPDGFTVRHIQGEQDAEAWVDLYNNSFIDHWNHHDETVENLKHWLGRADYRADLDLVAIANDGTFAAFCYSEIHSEYSARMGTNLSYVDILGTRRGFRKMGLGRAMLLSALHKLKNAGMDVARLGVDANNPNGALRLYESVGFCKVLTSLSYVKDV
jgi:mycothiol synthase